MPTTALLVEIVIVGFGFFLSILPFAAVTFNVSPLEILAFYGSIPIQFQLAASFAAGVLWNRVCDQVFHRVDDKIICSMFPSREAYQEARIKVVLQGESIRDYIGNYRSLIRVSRASSVLLLIYAVATPIYFLGHELLEDLASCSKAGIVLCALTLLSMSTYAWYRLERGYVAAVRDAHAAVSSKERSKSRERRTPEENERPRNDGCGEGASGRERVA